MNGVTGPPSGDSYALENVAPVLEQQSLRRPGRDELRVGGKDRCARSEEVPLRRHRQVRGPVVDYRHDDGAVTGDLDIPGDAGKIRRAVDGQIRPVEKKVAVRH